MLPTPLPKKPRAKKASEVAASAALPEALRLAASASIPAEPGLWVSRSLAGRADRSLHEIDQRAMIEKCYTLFLRNPYAGRIVEMQKAFVIGGGFKFRAKHPLVEGLLARHWERNKMNTRLPNIQRDKSIFGEHIPRLVTNLAGDVKLGSIDPSLVSEMEINPLNAEEVLSISVYYEGKSHKLRVAAVDKLGVSRETMKETYGNASRKALAGRLTGEVMLFQVNKPSGAYRGVSDLYRIADSLEVAEEMGFNFADRTRLANYIHFVLTVEGATPEQVAAMNTPGNALYIPPPVPGQRLVVSDKIKSEAWAPNMNAADMKDAMQTALLPIASGSYNSIHDFGMGEDVNRASASEMNSPRDRFYTERQAALIEDAWQLDEFAIEQKRIFLPQMFAGLAEEDFEHWVEAGEISGKDEAARANVLSATLNSVAASIQTGTITHEQAVEITREAYAAAGVQVDWNKLGGLPPAPESSEPQDMNASTDAADAILAAVQEALKQTPATV